MSREAAAGATAPGVDAPGAGSGRSRKTSTHAAPVLVVGARRGAIGAAARRGLAVIVIDDRPIRSSPARALARTVNVSLADRKALHDAVRALGPLAAVIAPTERTVIAGAMAREVAGGVGPDLAVARLFREKPEMKAALAAAGVRVNRHLVCGPGTDWLPFARDVGFPLVVKPAAGSGGLHIRIAGDERAVVGALETLPGRRSSPALVEPFLALPELSIESLVARGRVIFTSITGYIAYGRTNLVSPDLPSRTARAIRACNERAIGALGLADGMTHLELFLSPDGPIVSEVAARPPGGHLMDLIARAHGFDPWEALVDIHLGLTPRLPRRRRCHAGNIVYYPPPGRVARIDGLDAVRKMPGVALARLRLAPGDVLPPRRSLSQSRGLITVTGPDANAVRRTLDAVERTLRVTVEPAGPHDTPPAGLTLPALAASPPISRSSAYR